MERFWSKVDTNGPVPEYAPHLGPCWIWTAARSGGGYGQFWFIDRLLYSHRFTYEWLVGPIGDGLTIDHLCRVPACCNPLHLEPVSNKVNILRGTSPPAQNAVRTHCVNGHPFDEMNTHNGTQGRKCRACRARRERDRQRRLRAEQRG